MYYQCEMPNIRDPKFRTRIRHLRNLESKRSGIFNEAKLRQSMICGVQIGHVDGKEKGNQELAPSDRIVEKTKFIGQKPTKKLSQIQETS